MPDPTGGGMATCSLNLSTTTSGDGRCHVQPATRTNNPDMSMETRTGLLIHLQKRGCPAPATAYFQAVPKLRFQAHHTVNAATSTATVLFRQLPGSHSPAFPENTRHQPGAAGVKAAAEPAILPMEPTHTGQARATEHQRSEPAVMQNICNT